MTGTEVIGSAVVPRIVDPGKDGWPDEPKVSRAEELLYGEFAPAMRLLGQAAASAADAYGLVCKELKDADDDPTIPSAEWVGDLIGKAYASYQLAHATHRNAASIVLELMDRRSEMRESVRQRR